MVLHIYREGWSYPFYKSYPEQILHKTRNSPRTRLYRTIWCSPPDSPVHTTRLFGGAGQCTPTGGDLVRQFSSQQVSALAAEATPGWPSSRGVLFPRGPPQQPVEANVGAACRTTRPPHKDTASSKWIWHGATPHGPASTSAAA